MSGRKRTKYGARRLEGLHGDDDKHCRVLESIPAQALTTASWRRLPVVRAAAAGMGCVNVGGSMQAAVMAGTAVIGMAIRCGELDDVASSMGSNVHLQAGRSR